MLCRVTGSIFMLLLILVRLDRLVDDPLMAEGARTRVIDPGLPGERAAEDDDPRLADGQERADETGHLQDAVLYPYLASAGDLSSGGPRGEALYQVVAARDLSPELRRADMAGIATAPNTIKTV